MSVGVVIGRFQIAQLHEGHIALLSAVAARSTRLVVLIGVSPAPLNENGRSRLSSSLLVRQTFADIRTRAVVTTEVPA